MPKPAAEKTVYWSI